MTAASNGVSNGVRPLRRAEELDDVSQLITMKVII